MINKSFVQAFFIAVVSFFASAAADACQTECHGCNRKNINRYPDWSAYVDHMTAAGMAPISCFRTFQCQQKLVDCYGIGRAARAGHSNHENDNVAADFSSGHASAAKAALFQYVRGAKGVIWHGSCGAGSLHVSNSSREQNCSGNYRPRNKKVQKYRQGRNGRRHRRHR